MAFVEAWRRWLASFLDVGNPDDLEAMQPRVVPQPHEVLLRRGTQSHLQADVSASQCFEVWQSRIGGSTDLFHA